MNDIVLNILKQMLFELENNILKIVIIREYKIRQVESKNISWYRELCKKYISDRTKKRNRKTKFTDTKIKRKHIIKILTDLTTQGCSNSKYTQDLIDIATERVPDFDELAQFNKDAETLSFEELLEKWGPYYVYGEENE